MLAPGTATDSQELDRAGFSQPRIDRYFTTYHDNKRVAAIKSKRLRTAVGDLAHGPTEVCVCVLFEMRRGVCACVCICACVSLCAYASASECACVCVCVCCDGFHTRCATHVFADGHTTYEV